MKRNAIILLLILVFLLVGCKRKAVEGEKSSKLTKSLTAGEPEINDYLIITTAEIIEVLDDFVDHKKLLGFDVKVTGLNEITSSNVVGIRQNDIREYLQEENAGKSPPSHYVLLIGSTNEIPMYVAENECDDETKCQDSGKVYVWTDKFYADLSSNWDSVAKGDGGTFEDQLDYTNEVIVGRIPFDDKEIVSDILDRTIAFEKSNESWKKQALLAGAKIILRNDSSFLVRAIYRNVFDRENATVFLEKGKFKSEDIKTFSDRLASSDFGFVFIVSHGDEDGVYYQIPEDGSFLHVSDVSRFNKDRSAVYVSAACSNGLPTGESLPMELLRANAIVFVGTTTVAYPTDYKDLSGVVAEYRFPLFYVKQGYSVGVAKDQSEEMYLVSNMGQGFNIFNHFNLIGFQTYGDPSVEY